MLKSVSQRIKISKRGKVIRRAMGLSHSRANKSPRQLRRRRKNRGMEGRSMHKTLTSRYL